MQWKAHQRICSFRKPGDRTSHCFVEHKLAEFIQLRRIFFPNEIDFLKNSRKCFLIKRLVVHTTPTFMIGDQM